MGDPLPDAIIRLKSALDEMLAAPILRGSESPGSRLPEALRLRGLTEDIITATVEHARGEGASWKTIGDGLGVTRQAAFQRYGKPTDPRTGEPMNTTPLSGAEKLALAVIDELAAGDWQKVTARFDPAMNSALSEEALSAAWAQVVGLAGALESSGCPEVARAADVTITNTPLNLEAGEFIARIAFRDDQSIAGLFILQPDAA